MGGDRVAAWEEGTEALCAGLSRPWEAQHSDPVPLTSAGGTGEESTELPGRLGGAQSSLWQAFQRSNGHEETYHSRQEHSRKNIACSAVIVPWAGTQNLGTAEEERRSQ